MASSAPDARAATPLADRFLCDVACVDDGDTPRCKNGTAVRPKAAFAPPPISAPTRAGLSSITRSAPWHECCMAPRLKLFEWSDGFQTFTVAASS